LGTSVRTAERCVRRFKDAGLLEVRRRGTGRSAIYVLCIDGEPLFPNSRHPPKKRKTLPDPTRMADQDPTKESGQIAPDPTWMADESLESYESCEAESKQRPPPPPSSASRLQGQSNKRTSGQALQNKIVQRLGNGDTAQGWLLFGALDELDRKHLEQLEREGVGIDDALLHEYRITAAKWLDRSP
jgi:hypothetical protein